MRGGGLVGLVALVAACNGSRPASPSGATTTAPARADAVGLAPAGPPARGVTSIAAAARTTCFVRSGRLYCFGAPVGTNTYGHNPGASPEPRAIPGLDDVAEIALADDHACVRRRAGGVACWGALDDGTLGETGPKGGYRPRVVAAPEPIAGVVANQLAVGVGFACALAGDGTVSCWGMNEGGVLGTDGPGTLRPRAVPGVAGVVELRASGDRACARLRGGDVTCWGGGVSTQKGSPRPTVVAALAGAKRLAMRERRGCALREGGEVACEERNAEAAPPDTIDVAFGDGARCALRASGEVDCDGNGTASTNGAVAGIRDAIAIAAGTGHACALDRAGGIRCWGANDAGQSGRAFRVTIPAPTPIQGVTRAVKVAISALGTCALRAEGDVWCWGDPMDGELGVPEPSSGPERARPRPGAARVAGVVDAVAISGGSTHFCALTRRATIACWGRNGAKPCTSSAPECAMPTDLAGVRDAIEVSSAREGNCAVRASGDVVCWGAEHELGLRGKPAWTGGAPIVVDGVKNAAHVFFGYRRACAVRRNGSAVCWGENVGFEASAVRHTSATLAEIQGARDLVAIGRGQPDHALSRSGEVRAFDWGNSFVRATRPDAPLEIAPPLPNVIVADATKIAQGTGETCALRRSGQIVCWGMPATVTPAGVDDAIDLAVAESGTRCAVRKNGEVVCWGENEHAQCGVDPGVFVAAPEDVRMSP